MKKAGIEFKVGVFVMTALLVLAGLVLKAGDFTLKPGYMLTFSFNLISGIDHGSPVMLAGVNIGEVTDIDVVRSPEGATQVEVKVRISGTVYIEDDAKVRINSLGLLGEKYIEILPGTSGNRALQNGETVIGRSPFVIEDIADSGHRLINKIEYTVDNLNEVVADPDFKKSVKGTFGNAEKLSKNLMQTTEDMRDAARSARIILARLRDGEGSIGRLLKNDQMAKDIEDFVKDIKAHPWKLLKRN